MVQVTIEIDSKKLENFMRELQGSQIKRAVSRAMRRALRSGRASASQQFRAVYKLPAAVIKDRINVDTPVNVSKDVRGVTGAIKISAKPIPLYQYRASQKKAGVSVSVGKGRKVIRGSFIATMPSGHIGVFRRDPLKQKRRIWVRDASKPDGGYYKELPITQLWGPSPYQFFKVQNNLDSLKKVVEDAFSRSLDHELAYALIESQKKSGAKPTVTPPSSSLPSEEGAGDA